MVEAINPAISISRNNPANIPTKIAAPSHEAIAGPPLQLVASETVPRLDWKDMGDPEHFVQFYESDTFLLDSLSGFIGTGLREADACIVVATEAHRLGLEDRLTSEGLDVAASREWGQYFPLDAGATLLEFMDNGSPAPERFAKVIGGIIARAAERGRRVRVYGEMVALLWAERNYDAAIDLEGLWNDLHKANSFSLFCAYPINGSDGEACGGVEQVCQAHSRVIPAESYTALDTPDQRLRAIIKLQKRARLLENEIAERKQAEENLRAVKGELEVQVEDLRRLHQMSADLTSTLNMELVLREVLRAAEEVQAADMGLLSLCDKERDGLSVKVHSGFDPEFVKQVEWIQSGVGPCGICYEQRRRIVIEDVRLDRIFSPYQVGTTSRFRASHSTPLIDRSGNLIGVLSVHFREPHRPSERQIRLMDLYARMAADIIENAQLHHRLQQELDLRAEMVTSEQIARAEAEAANRMKDEFLATASHELRTPLTAIIGWSHMLRNRDLDEATAARALETIGRNARLQAQLVEDLLDVSRVITGKLRLKIAPVDLASIINAAIDSVQLAADSKRIRLEMKLDPSTRHTSGDPSRLQQVVWNLLSNAIKFTPIGGLVAVQLERANSNVHIRVSDNGLGISRDFLPFIFDRFRQADATSTRRHGGLGLGLAIVRHLVELHGGTVHAESLGEGCGATFTVVLPLAGAQEPAKNGIREVENLRIRGSNNETAPLSSLENVQVLLVDDDPETLRMLTVMLAEAKGTVQAATSAAEALDLLTWYKPDVLVSDLAMPDEDGYWLIDQIRKREAKSGNATPAIALTAHARIDDRARALSAGFNMFVPKPVEPDELIAAIANLTETNATNCA